MLHDDFTPESTPLLLVVGLDFLEVLTCTFMQLFGYPKRLITLLEELVLISSKLLNLSTQLFGFVGVVLHFLLQLDNQLVQSVDIATSGFKRQVFSFHISHRVQFLRGA